MTELPDELRLTSAPEHARPDPLNVVPEPWHGRLTLRRPRRWAHAWRAIRRYNARLPPDAPTLNFYPMLPQPRAPIFEMARLLGVRIGHSWGSGLATFAWDGDTWFSPRSSRRLPADALNVRCLDISKSLVHTAWQAASGTSLVVDPTRFNGPLVEKPEENGHHAGRVVYGPLPAQSGFVYERLVDCRVGDYITQTRPVIIGEEIVLVYEKWRASDDRFFGTLLSLPRDPGEVYSATECATLLRFTREMKMDYGELDVLRDPADGQIYVVDANRTPSRPHALPARFEPDVWQRQADALARLISLRSG